MIGTTILNPPSSPHSLISAIQSQMGSSSFPDEHEEGNIPDVENEIDSPEQEEFATPENGGKRKDAPETSGATSKPAKELKTIIPRSPAWEHFTRTKDDRNKCLCHYCKKSFCCKSKSGTSNLFKHLAACKQYLTWKENKSQQVINGDGNMQRAKVNETVFREATNEMIVIGELPLSFVESVAWRHFSSRVNLYRPHSRRTASRDIVQMYVNKKTLLKNWIVSNKQRVSLLAKVLLPLFVE